MRSSIVLASAFVIGAFAGPIEKRAIVTETSLTIETVIVYVTVTGESPQPTLESTSAFKDHYNYGGHRGPHRSRSRSRKSSTSSAYSPGYTSELPAPSSIVTSCSSPSLERPAPTTVVFRSRSTSEQPEPTSVVSSPIPTSDVPEPSSDVPEPTSDVPEPTSDVPEPTSEQREPTSVVPTSTTAAAGSHPTGAIQATLQSGPDYQAAVLYHHNAARANHNAAPLVWDSECEAGARRTAEMCIFAHPDFLGDIDQGQNLFTVSGDSFNVTAGITESWYKGELEPMMPHFGKDNVPDDVFHEVGHLTALLWKATTKVGCVSLDCGSKMKFGDGTPTDLNKFTVCNYASPGNFAGKFAENVDPPISTDNLGSWLD